MNKIRFKIDQVKLKNRNYMCHDEYSQNSFSDHETTYGSRNHSSSYKEILDLKNYRSIKHKVSILMKNK